MAERVRAIIGEQLGHPLDDGDPGCRLVGDLQADSLDLVEVMLCLEEAFYIELIDEEAMTVTTVQEAIDAVTAKAGV